MTRFARAEGSKASNKKVPEDATPWGQLKAGAMSEEGQSDDSDQEHSDQSVEASSHGKDKSWSVIEDNKVSKVKKVHGQKRKSEAITEMKPGKKHLGNIKDVQFNKKFKKDNSNSHQTTEMKTDFHNKESSNKQPKKVYRTQPKQCFACRGTGHEFASCPNVKNTDTCFVCGSLEHKVKDCKQRKSDQTNYKFATCFICNEVGHLSSSCPDNPRGIYPHGGSCRLCGEVTHLAKNCPKKKKQKETKQITVPTLSNDIEGLPEDNKFKKNKMKIKKVKKVNF